MKDRGFTRLRYAHKGHGDRTEGMAFSTFVFEGREAERLREYRSKRIDTHLLSAILCEVNMAHRYRPLQPIKMGGMSDIVGY